MNIQEVKRLEREEKEKKVLSMDPETRYKELDDIIRQVTSVHMKNTLHTPEFFDKLPYLEDQYVVSY